MATNGIGSTFLIDKSDIIAIILDFVCVCFRSLSLQQETPLLQELSIAQNRLQTIYMDAFKELISLKRLNLSYNHLEEINEFVFDEINIEMLDLSGNNFMYQEGKTLFRSNSLKVIFIGNSLLFR